MTKPISQRLLDSEIRKPEARKILERYQRNHALNNSKGFRIPSQKAGPARQMSVWDSLAIIAFGADNRPFAIPGRRVTGKPTDQITPQQRREMYLKAVRETKGNLPTGDTRLKSRA